MTSSFNYQDIIRFWFSERVAKLWFNSTEEFDNELRQKYETVYNDAVVGKYDGWMQSPEGALALIILFDQLPLNIYRGNKQSFATESRARDVARYALSHSFDRSLTDSQKAFMYMPFMHSENMEDQDLSIELFEGADLKNNIKFAHHHRSIIERFGRFPHRNRILDRESTDAELEYLQSKEAFLG